MPNGVTSHYTYDDVGRLTQLRHLAGTQPLAEYAYALDQVGNRTALTETVTVPETPIADGYQAVDGLVVIEAENTVQATLGSPHAWTMKTSQPGYTGTGYLHSLPDLDHTIQPDQIATSPSLHYPIHFTTPGTYTVWLRGLATTAQADSVYVDLAGQTLDATGFIPRQWSWASIDQTGQPVRLHIQQSGVHTLTLSMREDGLRLDRLLLTTDTTYLPTDFGPPESVYLTATGNTTDTTTLARTITYTYDDLYRLTQAIYSDGDIYAYSYDPVGNRLQQIIGGDTTSYLYDAANRLASVDGQPYTYDDNGNLLTSDTMTNTFDSANRLISTNRAGTILQPMYDGLGNRVAQTKGATTTTFALDMGIALPEVLYTSDGNAYLHIPGVIMTENSLGEMRYLLSDGLGSVRQAIDETGSIVSYKEFDPYGSPIPHAPSPNPYAFTGEWWEEEVGLLHLRARWYLPEDGVFLSRDAVESEPPYQYVRGNPVNLTDPSGLFPEDCRMAHSDRAYAQCVLQHYSLLPATLPGFYRNRPFLWSMGIEIAYNDADLYADIRTDTGGCKYGPVPYQGPGYLEGFDATLKTFNGGREVTYDFASMERKRFVFFGDMISDGIFGGSVSTYVGYAFGFRSDQEIIEDYPGPSLLVSLGISQGGGFGMFVSKSFPSEQIIALADYVGASLAFDVPVIDFGVALVTYSTDPLPGKSYITARKVDKSLLSFDILRGADVWVTDRRLSLGSRIAAIPLALYFGYIHDEIYYTSLFFGNPL